MRYNNEQESSWINNTQDRFNQSQLYNNSSQTKQILYNQDLLQKQSRKTGLRKEQYQYEIEQAKQKYQQRLQQKQNEEQEKLENQNYVLKQFQNVPSRYLQDQQNYVQKSGVQKQFLPDSQKIKRRQSRQQIEQTQFVKTQRKEDNTDKPWRQQPIQKKPQNVNYIQKNYQELKQFEKTVKQDKQKQQVQTDNYKYGQVPKYLVQLKQELKEKKEAEQKQREQEELQKQIPPGCRLVPEEERQELLQQLKQALYDECRRYNSFPLRFDNQSLQQAKNESGQKIDDLEQTISQFERKGPLYIKI